MSNNSTRFWSPKKRATAVVLRQEGYTYDQIALRLGHGATKSGVYKICRKFQQEGNLHDHPRSGRKKVTTVQDDRMISRMVMKDRRISSVSIANALNRSGVKVSARTVRDRLFRNGLKARIPRRKPYLTVEQRKRRVEWAKRHLGWSDAQWSRVLFSDETKISIFGSDGIRYIRRKPGEQNLPACITPTMKHPVSVMLWGCMNRVGVGRIKVLEGSVNARKYITDVLESRLLQSASDIFGPDNHDFIFQQDSAPCHTAKICKDWFAEHGIEVMSWPGNSPDLNPIENLWSRLKRLVARNRPSNRTQLIEAIINSWHHIITEEDLQALVNSMHRRCAAVIKSRGYPTKY